MKKRWLGVDLGSARIGLALSDPLGVTAQPLSVLKSQGNQKDMEALGKLVDEHAVAKVIVGLPLSLKGEDSPQTKKVRDFTAKLAGRLDLPVFFVDERLTTTQAQRSMIQGGSSRKARKKSVDQVAAAILLQAALDGAHLIPVKSNE